MFKSCSIIGSNALMDNDKLEESSYGRFSNATTSLNVRRNFTPIAGQDLFFINERQTRTDTRFVPKGICKNGCGH